MNEGLNDMTFIREMLQEMVQVMIPAQLTIDCKNAYKVITGTTAPTDKKVRCEAAGVREALLEGEIEKVNLVKGKAMLATSSQRGRWSPTVCFTSSRQGRVWTSLVTDQRGGRKTRVT